MKIRTRILCLSGAVVAFVCIVAIVFLGYVRRVSQPLERELPAAIERLNRMSRTDSDVMLIRHYNEILSSSARLRVATGDLRYERRFFAHKQEFEQLLERVSRRHSDKQAVFFKEVAAAGNALVGTQLAAIRRAAGGDPDAALALLDAAESQAHRRALESSLRAYYEHRGSSFGQVTDEAAVTARLAAKNAQKISRRGVRATVLILTVAILVALITEFWVTRSIVRPIQVIADKATSLGGGDPSARVPVRSKDELGLLAATFNTMAENLAQTTVSRNELAAEVEHRKQIEQNLRRSNEELEQFAYIASHDLQEPLRMVTSYANLIDKRYKDKLDADGEEFIGFMTDGARRMSSLIRDLLQFSRVGNRKQPAVRTDPNEILPAILTDLQVMLQETGVSVTYDELPVVIVDPSQLGQLLQNLITNGIKFRSGSRPNIHVTGEVTGKMATLAVRDNGIGIDERYHGRIFEIFRKLHASDEYSGTGIGLAVCKKIVDRHGGRIWVDSQPGRGSVFTFQLPAAPQPPADPRCAHDEQGSTAASAAG